MGAFGRLLEAYFGGTIHDVKTWTKSTINEDKNIRINHTCDFCGFDVERVTYSPLHKKWECEDCIKKK